MNPVKPDPTQLKSNMKAFLLGHPMVCLVAGVAFVAPAQAQPATLAASLDAVVLNSMLPALKNDFFPGIIDSANDLIDDNLSASAKSKINGIGEAEVRAEVFNFNLDPLTESQLSIKAVELSSSDRALIRIEGKDFNLQASAGASARAKLYNPVTSLPDIPVKCGIGVTVTFLIPSITVGIGIKIGSGGKLDIDPLSELRLPNVVVFLTPFIDSVCSALAAPVISALDTSVSLNLGGLLSTFLLDKALPTYLGQLIGESISLADLGSFGLSDIAAVSPLLNIYRLETSAGELETAAATTFSVDLIEPSYRAGRSLGPAVGDGRQLPAPAATDLANINLR